MKKLSIDLGVEEFEVDNGKVLRFNPADLNLFNRFLAAKEDILAVEAKMVEKAETIGDEMDGETVIRLIAEADAEMKQILNRVFGGGNDFDDIFSGVNLLAVGNNGERIVTNFIAAIAPVLEEGAKKAAKEIAAQDAENIRKGMQLRGGKV